MCTERDFRITRWGDHGVIQFISGQINYSLLPFHWKYLPSGALGGGGLRSVSAPPKDAVDSISRSGDLRVCDERAVGLISSAFPASLPMSYGACILGDLYFNIYHLGHIWDLPTSYALPANRAKEGTRRGIRIHGRISRP